MQNHVLNYRKIIYKYVRIKVRNYYQQHSSPVIQKLAHFYVHSCTDEKPLKQTKLNTYHQIYKITQTYPAIVRTTSYIVSILIYTDLINSCCMLQNKKIIHNTVL